jgi:Methyltransferase domain
MDDSLKLETERLIRSWMQYEPAKLRDYLVAGVEDPRVNLQSVFSRHFLLRSLFGKKFGPLMIEEVRFAAVMNWLGAMEVNASDPDELEALSFALSRGADNAEGLEIPRFILKTFSSLPLVSESIVIPSYVEARLAEARNKNPSVVGMSLNTFQVLWRERLARETTPPEGQTPTVLEPACGSANDYRFLDSFGIAQFLDYTGFDLCLTNIENARVLFPRAHFEEGNVFEINAPDGAFDFCFVHDLFEHLSLEGMQTAIKELCRVTRRAICANFFQMDEIPDHVVRPMDEYHWNLLSADQVKKAFAAQGYSSQIIRIKSFLRQEIGCDYTHNPNAYTFILHRTGSGAQGGGRDDEAIGPMDARSRSMTGLCEDRTFNTSGRK